jgi:hypothetical protein
VTTNNDSAGAATPDNQRAIQLQQLANIVIDAYLNRYQRPEPDFGEHTAAVFFFERPKGDNADLQVGYWYEKKDSDPEGQQ